MDVVIKYKGQYLTHRGGKWAFTDDHRSACVYDDDGKNVDEQLRQVFDEFGVKWEKEPFAPPND
jgi:hypothetical protein